MTLAASFRVIPKILVLSGASLLAATLVPAQGWGTAPGYTTLMGYQLSGMYVSNEGPLRQELGATYCQVSPGSYDRQAAAQLDFPDGASLDQLQFWAYDADPTYWLTFDVFEARQAPGSGTPTTTLLGSAETFGAIGTYYAATPLNGHTVDNLHCTYSVRVAFSQPDQECVGQALQVQKIQVSWTRQVSPAPATATFNDVATNHPFFRFVEALAKSGITGGCGGGNFCPDQTLRRGQMAVFLAKGLGLAWP